MTRSARSQATIRQFVTAAERVVNVEAVSGPTQVSPDGRTGVGSLAFTGSQKDQAPSVKKLRAAADTARAAGVDVDFASYGFTEGGAVVTLDITTGRATEVARNSVAWWGAAVTTIAPVAPP